MPIALLEEGQHLAAEHAAEDAHREEEPATCGCHPAGVIEGQSAGGDETMQVRMMLEVLTPGVQHGEHTDACAEMAWIGSNLQQGLGSCAKQHRIEEPLIAQCK